MTMTSQRRLQHHALDPDEGERRTRKHTAEAKGRRGVRTTTGEKDIRVTFLRVQVLGLVVQMEEQVAAPLLLQGDQAWPKKNSSVNALNLIKVDMIFMAFHVLLAGQLGLGLTRRDGGLSEGLGRRHKTLRQSRKLSSGSVSFFTESK